MTRKGIKDKTQMIILTPFFPNLQNSERKTISYIVMTVQPHYFIKTFSVLNTFGSTDKLD